jgi:hypothetical protein
LFSLKLVRTNGFDTRVLELAIKYYN